MPTYRVTDPETGRKIKLTGDSPPTEAELIEIFASVPRETSKAEQPTARENINQAILDTPGGAELAEFGSGISRGATQLADFFTTKPANALLELAGSDTRIPELTEALSPATEGNFVEPGLKRDILRTSGELVGPAATLGAGLRATAGQIPKLQQGVETVRQGVTRQLGTSTAGQDITGAALSGLGAETGEEYFGETGELLGAFLAPMAGTAFQPAFKKLLSDGAIKTGKDLISKLTQPLIGMSDDGAAKLLAEAMVREGLSPDDVANRLKQLGPESIPADVGNNFSRLLRTAANKIPRIEGQAADVLKARQSGQGNRILSAFDDATGTSSLNIDDEITRLNKTLKPQINKLYSDAGAKGINVSPRLKSLLEGKNSVNKAMKKAQGRLADKRAAGDQITHIDIIDATKQELDDQIGTAIRKGANNKARDLIRLKNLMINEADTAIPEYKQARDLFAGKANMENAAQSGELFIRMKPRDVRELTKSFGASEKKMFKLGAKQAVIDKIDDLQTNADAVKRLFGKNGDVKKLRHLFDTKKQFDQFSDTLERESNFILTRRAAQANSTTTKQLFDDESAFNVLSDTATAIASPKAAAGLLNRVISGLGKGKAEKEYIKALEDVGDILLVKGIEQDRIISLLKSGKSKQIEAFVRHALKQPTKSPWVPASTVGGVEAIEDQ